jgi:predicted nucleic acid-binding protein
MNVVVDTNVVAYYLLNTEPHVDECKEFWRRIDTTTAPASWQAELLSVIWMAVRTKVITPNDSVTKLKAAASLGIHPVPVRQLWRGALRRSIDSEISPYDVLFVELAIRRKQKLVTFDRQLLRAFPDVAKRPADVLAR